MNTASHLASHEELDYRENDGIQVALLWSRRDDHLTVSVLDTCTDEAFELAVAPGEALDVFHHPFAYAAFGETTPGLVRVDRALERQASRSAAA